jgi:hypothetical protein
MKREDILKLISLNISKQYYTKDLSWFDPNLLLTELESNGLVSNLSVVFDQEDEADRPDSLSVVINKLTRPQIMIIDDIARLYDCGSEFNIRLTGEQIKNILEEPDNNHIVFNILNYGCETTVGDDFYEILVEKITGESYHSLKNKMSSDDFYKHVVDTARNSGKWVIWK